MTLRPFQVRDDGIETQRPAQRAQGFGGGTGGHQDHARRLEFPDLPTIVERMIIHPENGRTFEGPQRRRASTGRGFHRFARREIARGLGIRAAQAAQDFAGDAGENPVGLADHALFDRGRQVDDAEEINRLAKPFVEIMRHGLLHLHRLGGDAAVEKQFAHPGDEFVIHQVGIFHRQSICRRRRDPANQAAQEKFRQMHLAGLGQQDALDQAHHRQAQRRGRQQAGEAKRQRRGGGLKLAHEGESAFASGRRFDRHRRSDSGGQLFYDGQRRQNHRRHLRQRGAVDEPRPGRDQFRLGGKHRDRHAGGRHGPAPGPPRFTAQAMIGRARLRGPGMDVLHAAIGIERGAPPELLRQHLENRHRLMRPPFRQQPAHAAAVPRASETVACDDDQAPSIRRNQFPRRAGQGAPRTGAQDHLVGLGGIDPPCPHIAKTAELLQEQAKFLERFLPQDHGGRVIDDEGHFQPAGPGRFLRGQPDPLLGDALHCFLLVQHPDGAGGNASSEGPQRAGQFARARQGASGGNAQGQAVRAVLRRRCF